MRESILEVNYRIDGIFSVIPTKVVCEKSHDNETQRIYYVIKNENFNIISKACRDTESSIINLQQVLPSNIKIACCQSCKNGNLCPYGDVDNEIFCLKGLIINDKNDVLEFFTEKHELARTRSRKLLDFCRDYEPICHNKYYTYNDWGLK